MLEAAKKMIKSAESFLRANEEAVSVGQALATDIEKFGATLGPQARSGARLSQLGVDGYHCVLSEWR
jgi:hypothetical protein